ncbi:MAG: response regulator, partial [Calditrichaeota bacterium]
NTFWVNDIAITSEDTFYLATNNGLYKYIDHQIELIPFDPFFHNSELKSITVDGAGHIWIGTSQGIFVLVQNQLIPFYLQDGLPSRTIAYRSIVSDHQDNVWIGTFQGVTRWNTQRNQFHQSPTPVILSIVVEEPGGKQYFLEKPTIERGKNLIFKVSNFVYPIHHVKYRWRIDSITRGWLESETGRDIFLHHLPPGDYTIEIQAQQSGHLWSPSATFSFTIPPPWYQTWRGYGLFFFLFVTIIFFLGKLYVLWKERKSTQESLEQLSLAVEQTGGVIFMTDKEGVITYVNQAFERVYGYRKEEALGKTPRILKSNLVPLETYKAFWDTILSGQIFEGEFVNKTKDGKLVHMKVSVAPFREKGQILGFIAAQEDISELKNAEEELKHYATELESAKIALEEHANRLSMTISELEIARLKAEEASKAKSEFVANMSHEIRTPMNGIIGMTDLALETELTEEQREYLEAVKSSANSLLTIINDILDFSKIEAGKLALEYIAFRIRPFVIETIKSQAFREKEKNLEILYYVEPEVPEGVKGDPVRIRQILINLLGNAIKFTSHGEILLYIGLEQPIENNVAQIHLVVRDTGIGIPPEKQELIFEAFSQADTSITRKFGGTGLGLAITTQLVKLMNGKIWVESPPRYTLPGVDISDTRNGNGKLLPENITSPENNSHKSTTNQQEGAGPGSAFHIILPLEIAEPEEQPETTPVNLSELKDHKALIVDDNPTNRTILEKMLTQWGMIPISAEDGEKALERINSAAESNENFSVILLDAQMPNMDGFTLSQKIRKVPGYSAVPQIMLTSAGTRGDAQRCKELGIEGYLTKPVSMIQLQMTLYNCLSSKKVRQEKKPLITRHVIQENLPILNILLVEDNKINQKVATRMLEKMGHRITVASNGVEGVEKWKKQQFDLIFMDVQMPEMDGFEATAQIRELEKKRGTHVPIIAMTAHAMKGDRERCLAAGMDDYVAKPIKREEVEEVIQRFIHSKESTTQLDVEELENEHLE